MRNRAGRPFDLPPRYDEDWMGSFYAYMGGRLYDAKQILDVGSGRAPAIPPSLRPSGCRYVGLDVALSELLLAAEGSYDEVVCDDLTASRPALLGQFDLIVSRNVLEHVAEPCLALGHLRSYLADGGRMVALLSGRYSCFGLANRLLPNRLTQPLAAYVTGRDRDTVFRAYYRGCYYDGLAHLLTGWRRSEIHPRYRGEIYFHFSRTAHRVYLAYESWTYQTQRRNLATHYFVVAEP